jgi:hypothetical protein
VKRRAVVVAPREAPGHAGFPRAEEERIVDPPPDLHVLSGHAAVEKRQLRIDARHRPLEPDRAGDAQRHAFREYQVQDAILQPLARDGGGERPFDTVRVDGAIDAFVDASADVENVRGGQATLARVVVADQL